MTNQTRTEPLDLDRLAANHQESPSAPEGMRNVCLTCWQNWPCDAASLIAEAREAARLRSELGDVYDTGWRDHEAGIQLRRAEVVRAALVRP